MVQNKHISFLIKDNELLKKYKIRSYEEKVNTNFHYDKMPQEGSHFTFLSVIKIHSVFKMDKNYYLQVVLEECKYIV